MKYKGEGEDPIMHTVQRLIIHPDYYQTSGETVTGADSNEIHFNVSDWSVVTNTVLSLAETDILFTTL